MEVLDLILKLARQLYPEGRAFKMPKDGIFEGLNKALSKSEERAFIDAKSIYDSILPDNDGFSAEDATAWERRLGIISNSNVSLEARKLAIKRKINHPGTIKARQHYLYLEGQLQAAGFVDIYVFENRFLNGSGGYDTKTPEEITGMSFITDIQHGEVEHGEAEHGGVYNNLIVNNIEEERDYSFNLGEDLRSTFFIGGNPLGSFANVDINRKDELRQLILRIKPRQTVGFLFINYI